MNKQPKYYRISSKKVRHINVNEEKNNKRIIEDNNNSRKKSLNKLKYKYPNLEKHEYKIPINFKIEFNAPIFENNNFYKRKNLNLSVSMKNIEMNKKYDKIKYKRIPPSFTIPNHIKIIDQIREEENKERKKLKNNYNIYRKEVKKRGGDTSEKFFKSISRNILNNKRIYIRNMDNLYDKKLKDLNLFLTEEENYNNIKLKNEIKRNDYINKTESNINNSLNKGREILLNKVYKFRNKSESINLVDPNLDKNYKYIIENERVVDKILSIPSYIDI